MRWIPAVLALAGCAGPCAKVAAERRALAERRAPPTATPHVQIRVPFAVANQLIAGVLDDAPKIAIAPEWIGELGPFQRFVSDLYAIPREVTLAPADAGRVQLVTAIEIGDRAGPLLVVHARSDVAAAIERPGSAGPRSDAQRRGEEIEREPGRLFVTLAVPPDQASRLRIDLGPRAAEELGAALVTRLPDIARDHVPRPVIDRVAAAVVEQIVERGYTLGQGALLRQLADRMRVRIELPELPAERVVVTSIGDRALELAVFTTLPVRAGIPAEVAPMGDDVDIRIAGSAAAELVDWGIAHGTLPPRYTRALKPDPTGEYVPYVDWRPGDARPLVVHMFRLDGGCGHFISALQPHLALAGDQLDSWATNQTLEHADSFFALELLARLDDLVHDPTTDKKHTRSALNIAIGGREVSAHLTHAEVTDREIHVAVAITLGARRR